MALCIPVVASQFVGACKCFMGVSKIEGCQFTTVGETSFGKLANRLMQLPGVKGVRVKMAKLEIFADCEVAIRLETGQW